MSMGRELSVCVYVCGGGSHSDPKSRWLGKFGRGGGPVSTCGCAVVEESCKIQRDDVVKGFEGEEQDFLRNAIFNGEPLKDMSYMTGGRGSGEGASSKVLDQLEFMDGFSR